MLESAERRVAELEAPLQAPAVTNKIAVLPSLVELYLTDLKGSLGRDTERARSLLAKLIGQVTLRRNGQRLVAELQGNLSGLLELDNQPLYKGGSGGPILIVSAVPAPRGQLGGLGSQPGPQPNRHAGGYRPRKRRTRPPQTRALWWSAPIGAH